ncbi:Metal-dependent phosphohydrolase domain containing protein [Aphelenchoides bicaudatus]|nr:Metal-dependent phosphohydrolase domain containing protein [Aphelenchoides bicaudatus]
MHPRRKKQEFEIERSINCNVHGSIDIIKPLSSIIDTPQFQRLRRIEQLSFCNRVYPTARHSRFEHSLGAYRLAFNFANFLSRNYEDAVTKADIYCISIAALIHDIGHGPFSHFYEVFMKESGHPTWKHEQATIQMWEHLLESNPNVRKELEHYLNEKDFIFIKELINPPKNLFKLEEWPMKGRPKEKSFLFCIVSNANDGLDTDKMDYILRDSTNANVAIGCSISMINRLMNSFEIGQPDEGKGLMRLLYQQKILDDVYHMLSYRVRLHHVIYRHKTVVAIDKQMLKVLKLADKHLTFYGSNGKAFSLSEAAYDMEAFMKVTDDFLIYIRNSVSEVLKPARNLLTDIDCRRIYHEFGSFNCKDSNEANKIVNEIHDFFEGRLAKDKYFIDLSEMHSGLGMEENPLTRMLVCDPNSPNAHWIPEHDIELKRIACFVLARVYYDGYDMPSELKRQFKDFELQVYRKESATSAPSTSAT